MSQTTVTRVFTAPELVSPGTQAKVRAAAERLGYVPNAIARSLKSQRTNIVGAVVPAAGEYWQHALTAFSRQLAERGRQLLLFSFTDDEQVRHVLDSVRQYRVDGIVLASAKISQAHLATMQAHGVPLVAFNQPAAAGIVASVSVDNEAGTRVLADHLIGQGCRSVTFVGGIAATSTDQLRYQGAARTFGHHGIGCAYVEAGSFDYSSGLAMGERLAAEAGGPDGSLPDALMVSGDELAFGVIDGLRAAGIDVGGDVLVTGFDGLPQSSWAAYDLTTVEQNIDVLVARSIDQLIEPATDSPAPEIVAEGTLRLGTTTRRSRSTRSIDA